MADWMTGLLTGFLERKGQVEQENLRQADLARQREGAIYEALLQSPDPEIQSRAVAGLLESAKPGQRAKGLAGWLGQLEQNPYLPQIQALMQTPVRETRELVAEPPTVQGYLGTPPPVTGAAAQADTSPTQGTPLQVPQSLQAPIDDQLTVNVRGLPPEIPDLGPVGVDPRLALAKPSTRAVTTERPRQAFLTPEEAQLRKARAASQGDVEGRVAGLVAAGVPEPEARETIRLAMVRQARGSAAAPFQAIVGEVVQPDGTTTPAYGVFNRVTQEWTDTEGNALTGFRPRPTGASATPRFGVTREALARATFGKDFNKLDQPDAAYVLELEKQQAQDLSRLRAKGTELGQFESPIDLSTAQRTGMPVGATAANMAGQRIPTTAQVDRRRSVMALQDQLQHIKGLLTVLPKSSDVIGGLAPGLVLATRRRDPRYRTQVAQLEAAVNNVVNVVARAVGEQRGTQTEQDAVRAEQAIVQLRDAFLRGDTQESALARIQETEGFIGTILNQLPAPVVGQPPPETTPGSGNGKTDVVGSKSRSWKEGNRWQISIP